MASLSSLFSSQARTEVVAAVREAEGQTAAEFVVVVRREADPHWGTAAFVGFVTAIATLLVLLFAETEFATSFIPIDIALSFVTGVAIFKLAPFGVRLFVPGHHRRASALKAAKAAFYDLGVSRTRDRTGVLVFAAMAERVAVVLQDVGIDTKMAGAAWSTAVTGAQASVAANDSAALARSVVDMGRALGALYPRKDDDQNELPDEMVS
jgi:putative membrane protein